MDMSEGEETMSEEEETAWLNSPVCSGCGVHPEEDEEHEEACPYAPAEEVR